RGPGYPLQFLDPRPKPPTSQKQIPAAKIDLLMRVLRDRGKAVTFVKSCGFTPRLLWRGSARPGYALGKKFGIPCRAYRRYEVS
ncbi:MAG: hypothetical protein LBL56_00585, partial [Treponema sp.]|nr:hypothetical protein [Treponema sp.]